MTDLWDFTGLGHRKGLFCDFVRAAAGGTTASLGGLDVPLTVEDCGVLLEGVQTRPRAGDRGVHSQTCADGAAFVSYGDGDDGVGGDGGDQGEEGGD